jgi:hypothetical protein
LLAAIPSSQVLYVHPLQLSYLYFNTIWIGGKYKFRDCLPLFSYSVLFAHFYNSVRVLPFSRIRAITLQCFPHGGKGKSLPGYLLRRKESNFEAFGTGLKIPIDETGTEDEIALVDEMQINEGIWLKVVDLDAGFFGRFASRTVQYGFPVLQPACGDGPFAAARFDRPPAEKDFAVQHRNGPDNHLRVLVMDGRAGLTDITKPVLAWRNPQRNFAAAMTTEVHDPSSQKQ